VSVTVVAEPRDDADEIEFTVRDRGCGIPPEAMPIIFEMFRQASDANTRRHGGVGLGLYIVKRHLEQLGGTIEVESEVGSGSTFQVRLPVRPLPICEP
jgi:signal transduction histidine kinase